MAILGVYNDAAHSMVLQEQTAQDQAAIDQAAARRAVLEAGSGQALLDADSESGASGDLVSLSDAASGLSSLSGSLTGSGTSILDTIESRNDTLQEQFLKTLNSKFDELGVDASTKITLTADDKSVVHVSGDHPDKDKIEKLFKDVPVLAEAFNELQKGSSLAKSIRASRGFQTARGGLALYSQMMDAMNGNKQTFNMSILENSASAYFTLG